jgi:hypothetical protein
MVCSCSLIVPCSYSSWMFSVHAALPFGCRRSVTYLIALERRHYLHEKRQQLLERLEVGCLHRLEVFNAPPEISLFHGCVPVQLDHKRAITRQ